MDVPVVRRRGRLVRLIALVLGGVVVLAAAGIAIFVATFDPNSRKPEIIAAVRDATGRELTINGSIGLSLLPQPTLQVSDVALSNPPGFSRPAMATLQHLELRVALRPLLSKEIRIEQLVLRDPDILLETNAKGQSNWEFASAGSLAAGAAGASPEIPREALPGAPSGAPSASSSAASPGASSGAIPEASSGAAPGAASEGGSAGVAPPALPSSEPSPAGNSDTRPPPRIGLSSLKIEGGTLALRTATGKTTTLALKQLTADETTPSAPLHLTLDATDNGVPVTLTADTGPLIGLTEGTSAERRAGATADGNPPWPIKLAATVAGARLNIAGTVAQPAAGRGLALALSTDIPDLAALSPLVGTALPPLKAIAAEFKLGDIDGGNGVAISNLALTMPSADLTGSLSAQQDDRPLIRANLSARRLDLDAISKAFAWGPRHRMEDHAASSAQNAPAPAAQSGLPAPPARSATQSDRVIPDNPLPFDTLRLADADLQLAVDDLRTGGQDYKTVKLHLVAKDGKLTLDPLTFDAPGAGPSGQVDLTATADANPSPPLVTLKLRAPGLALQPLLTALGKPGYASGTLELRADLSGAGATPRDIAASLNGAFGAAVAKGEIDNRLLGNLMATLLRQKELNRLADRSGTTALACFALRLDTTDGIGTLHALRLDSSTLGMTGEGTVNFGTEALDLHLRPTAGLGGTTITAPVIVDGTFADRSVHSDVAGTLTGNGATAARLGMGASTGGVALIIGSAVDRKSSGDPCAAPLALARFAQPPDPGAQAPDSGAQPDGSAPAPTQKPSKPNDPLKALKRLFQ